MPGTPTLDSISRRIAVLEAEKDIRIPVPRDRVEFARRVGLEPDPWQERVLRSEHPRILLNCARQSGKSTVAAILATHRALTVPGSLVLIVAPAERQAKETFSKAAQMYTALGETVPAESYRKLGVELRNGSRIEALPGTQKTIRGFSGVDLLIIDEAARVDDGLYYAVRPMLAVSGGRLMLLSTPFGKRGVFFSEWSGEASTGWERYEVTASQCPRIPPEFLAEEREALGPWFFQEYCCEFRETIDAVFSHDLVHAAFTDEVEPLFFEEAG
jgi:hypothetical protein